MKNKFLTVNSSTKSVSEMEEIGERLTKSGKKSYFAAKVDNLKSLSEADQIYIRTAPFIWKTDSESEPSIVAGYYIGLLMDETLPYIHLVALSKSAFDELMGIEGKLILGLVGG